MSEAAMNTDVPKWSKALAALLVALSAGCAFPADHRNEPGFTVGDGGVCPADGAANPASIVACGGRCVNTESNASHCGGCGITCAENQRCSLGRCAAVCANSTQCASGELCLQGTCVYAPPPASVLSTAVDEEVIRVRHSVEQLRLSAPGAVTFYYTLGGERPEPGEPATRTAMGQTFVLPTLEGLDSAAATNMCRTVRWFADYGPPLGREGVVHGATFCNNTAQSDTERNYETLDRFAFSVAGADQGAVAVVAPGVGVRVAFRLRTMNSGAAMMPARVSRVARVFLDQGTTADRPLFCHRYGDGSQPPTDATTAMFDQTLTAPMTPGRYALRLSIASDPSSDVCNNLNSLGTVRTIGVLIVR
ncbi:MAG: hypothetical protein JNK05_06225 [Myxococcales bacterium]|nr:hypothetical protein [Myxococcales bacterium]